METLINIEDTKLKKIKLLLDTDIGDDIDDAFALTFAHFNPNIDLVGVTTVFRNTVARAKQVKAFLNAVGKDDIEVVAGISKPIKEEIHYFKSDDLDVKGDVPCQHSNDYDKLLISNKDAIDYIYEMSVKYKGELVIAPIGPLTNIALTIKKYPEFTKNIKKIVLMGGYFNEEVPEWNIICDPEAAKIVFDSGANIDAIGLDVTLKTSFDPSLLKTLEEQNEPFQELLLTWFNRWNNYFNFDKSVLHDPLALVTIVNNETCEFKKVKVDVDLNKQRGVTKVIPNIGGNTNIAISVNTEVFNSEFIKTILK